MDLFSQDAFVALVQRRKQEEEGVQLTAKGKWVSEEYMKETLKFKEHLGLHWAGGYSQQHRRCTLDNLA